MKKISKVLSFILGAAITYPFLNLVDARAICMWNDDFSFKAPEGYVEVNDKGQASNTINQYFQEPSPYLIYRYEHQGNAYSDLYIYYDFWYNYTDFYIDSENIDSFEEIYAKYSESLNLSSYRKYENVDYFEVVMFDEYGRDGKKTSNISDVEDKSSIILQMTYDLKKSGCISKAEYKAVVAHETSGSCLGHSVKLNTNSVTDEEKQAEYDKVTEITNGFNGYVISDDKENGTDIDKGEYYVNINYEDYVDWSRAIKEVYIDSKSQSYLMVNDIYRAIGSNAIDLIAELDAQIYVAYGDLNIDGHIGIQDAIIMNKFIVGSVTLNEDQNKAADLNDDGNVNSEDLNLLLRYLVDDIDTLRVKK